MSEGLFFEEPLCYRILEVSTVAGSLTRASGYVEGTGSNAQFFFPSTVTYDYDLKAKAGRLLVADQRNDRFRAIDLNCG